MLNYCSNCGELINIGESRCKYCLTAQDSLPTTKSPLDAQQGGDHYSKLGEYQPWQVLAKWLTPEELRGFMKGTVISYLAREQDKGRDLDIKKALHTMQLFEELRTDAKDAGQLD